MNNVEILQLLSQLPVAGLVLFGVYLVWKQVSTFFEKQLERLTKYIDNRDRQQQQFLTTYCERNQDVLQEITRELRDHRVEFRSFVTSHRYGTGPLDPGKVKPL